MQRIRPPLELHDVGLDHGARREGVEDEIQPTTSVEMEELLHTLFHFHARRRSRTKDLTKSPSSTVAAQQSDTAQHTMTVRRRGRRLTDGRCNCSRASSVQDELAETTAHTCNAYAPPPSSVMLDLHRLYRCRNVGALLRPSQYIILHPFVNRNHHFHSCELKPLFLSVSGLRKEYPGYSFLNPEKHN